MLQRPCIARSDRRGSPKGWVTWRPQRAWIIIAHCVTPPAGPPNLALCRHAIHFRGEGRAPSGQSSTDRTGQLQCKRAHKPIAYLGITSLPEKVVGIVDHDIAHRFDCAASGSSERIERGLHHRRGNSATPVPLVDQQQRDPPKQTAVDRRHDGPSAATDDAFAIGDNQPALCPFERCDMSSNVVSCDPRPRELAKQLRERCGIAHGRRANMPSRSRYCLGVFTGNDSQRRLDG
jgi:hypothetical protein